MCLLKSDCQVCQQPFSSNAPSQPLTYARTFLCRAYAWQVRSGGGREAVAE